MNSAKLILAGVMASSLAFGQLTPISTEQMPESRVKPEFSGEKLHSALFLEDATTDGRFGRYLPKLGAELASALNKNGIYVARPEDHYSAEEPVDGQDAAMFRVQVARDIGATCYLTATVDDFDRVEIADGVFDLSLGLSLNAYGAARGDGVYGDTLTVTGRATAQQLARSGEAPINSLLKSAAGKMALSFAAGMRDNALKSRPASFRIDCNVPAVVVIDGAARGELGEGGVRTIETGPHTIEVVDNPDWPYYRPFKTRAFIENGSRFTVTLYLNDKGVERFKRVNDWILAHRREIDDLLVREASQELAVTDRSNAVTARWIAFTNAVARSTFADESTVRNGNRIVASSLRNGEKLVDAAIEDRKADRDQVWRRIETGHEEEMSRIAGDVTKSVAGSSAEVGVAEAEAKGEVGKAEVQRRIDAENHDYMKPVVEGVASQVRNSWSRLEDTSRLLHVCTRSAGDGIATVDYDPEEETTINLENKGSRKQK